MVASLGRFLEHLQVIQPLRSGLAAGCWLCASVGLWSSLLVPTARSQPAFTGRDTPPASENRLERKAQPKVLFDSYHAHNFLHRGLREHEYGYHQYSGLRRAAKLLTNRGCDVDELLVGPISEKTLKDVDLFVFNLPSMDRPPLLVTEVIALENFVRSGGGILFVIDHSNCYYHQYSLLPLWYPLGLTSTFETVCVADPSYRLSASGTGWTLIDDFADHEITRGIRHVAIQTGGRVVGGGEIAWTSELAWADAGATPLYGDGDIGLYGDWRRSDGEGRGKQAIAQARVIGQGRVCVISDQNCLGDAFISYADNWKFWLGACKWAGKLEYQRPSETFPGLQIHCYEPFGSSAIGSKRVLSTETAVGASEVLPVALNADFGSSDPDRLYNFWVWINRYHWAGGSDVDSRPPEYQSGSRMLIGDFKRITDPAFLRLASETIESGGTVLVLRTVVADFPVSGEEIPDWVRSLSGSLAGRWHSCSVSTETNSEIEYGGLELESFDFVPMPPVGGDRDLAQVGHVILFSDATPLLCESFPAPFTQPNGKQRQLQGWLQGALFSR